MVNHILNIHLPQVDSLERLVWRHSKNGKFTVKTTYHLSLEHSLVNGNEDVLSFWKKLGKLQIPPKWMLFTWKLVHRILPVRAVLKSKGLDVQLECLRCFQQEETLEHLCFKCSISRRVWRGSQLGFDFDNGGPLMVKDWLPEWFPSAPDDRAILESAKVFWGIWIF